MYKYIYILILLSALSACNNKLDEINENPNATENPLPPYLLTGVLKQGADLYWGSNASYNSSLLFVQHWAKIQYTEPDRYEFSNSEMTNLWDTGYATLITDLNTILNFPDEDAHSNYKGVALILRSWVFQLLTDTYGDIPYKEAGQKVTPAYDTQREVYLGLLEDLSEAQSLLSISGKAIEGDISYNGDISKWKRLANSLQLRIALRIADREATIAGETISKVTSDGIGVLNSNDDIFQFIYTNSPQNNPAAASFQTRDDYRISKTLVDKLYELSDPRLPVYAQLPTDETVNEYVGAANGLSTGDASSQGFARTSLPGSYFLVDESPAVFYSYAEVLFGLSEAVARGFISGDAESYYQQAITASFQQFGITDQNEISNYLAKPEVAFNSSNYKQSIGEQKWIAFFGQGLDAFAEWRRLDYPELVAGPATVLEGETPKRFFYPGSEQSLNGKNYLNAVSNQGQDLLTTKLWFDVY